MQAVSTSPASVISTYELVAVLASGRKVLVAEVLPRSYWVGGHIPGAVNMPLDAIALTLAEQAPDKDAEIVVYCASSTCQNSHIAAAKLSSLGYTGVRIFAGGKLAWRSAGLAVEVSP